MNRRDPEPHARAQAPRIGEDFVDLLAHDLRNPLNAVIMASAVLQKMSGDEAVCRLASRIQSSGTRMNRMVEDLLDFLRVQLNEGIALKRERADLAARLRQVVQEHRSSFPQVRIETLIEDTGAGHWDAQRLVQVASCLLENAARHGERRATVWVELREVSAQQLELSVSNAGSIAADELPYLFDPFFVAPRRTRERHCLGLGLYLARVIVEAHGGRIHAESAGGKVRFCVSLPCTVLQAPATDSIGHLALAGGHRESREGERAD